MSSCLLGVSLSFCEQVLGGTYMFAHGEASGFFVFWVLPRAKQNTKEFPMPISFRIITLLCAVFTIITPLFAENLPDISAAEQGDANAQYNLGVYYYNGEGVDQNYAEAVKWFRLAAEQGFATAQVILGSCYYNGEGVAYDYTEAVKWVRKAAEQGDAEAKQALEQMNWIRFFIHTVYSIFGRTAGGRLFFIMICFALVLIMKGISVIRIVLGLAFPSLRSGARPGTQPPSSQGKED